MGLRAAIGAALLAVLGLGLLAPPAARAFPPDRRRDYEERAPNEYLALPAVASLPGIGVFAGLIASGSNVGDSGIDVAATLAESIDNSDISVQAVALREVPTGLSPLSLDYQYAHIRLGNLETYLPGRDSPNFTFPITAKFDFQLLRPVLRLWERRIELNYTLAFFKGFDLDQFGNEAPLRRHSASAALLLDLTDDVVDPRSGLRLSYGTTLPPPRHSILGEDQGSEDTFFGSRDRRVHNYAVNLYAPLAESLYLAWSTQYFEVVGDVKPGEVVSGGSPPLRGYPAGRWSDRYGVFSGLELRYLYFLGRHLDIIIAHGVLEGLQFAAFYEVGQVSPENDHTLFGEMHPSYGAGVRALFEAIVVRFDLAFGTEGMQTHLTVGHAF